MTHQDDDMAALRRIEHAARDVDGLWSESRKLIHWQEEAGKALRDLRDALTDWNIGIDRRAALPARSDAGLRTADEWLHPDASWSGLSLCLASDARPGYGCVLPNNHDGDHDKWHRSALRAALAAADHDTRAGTGLDVREGGTE